MVSPISSSDSRFCPALDTSLAKPRCIADRVRKIQCPIDCQYNPFNPSAAAAFDAICGKGLAAAGRWLEKHIGSAEWGRRLDWMDRRFAPERDLPLIAYETQWWILDRALRTESYAELRGELEEEASSSLKNEARLFVEKLSSSRALMVQVLKSDPSWPYYEVQDVFESGRRYLYVDFGDQEPLEEGALLFGRFLVHQNCIYVIPGVFVGTSDILDTALEAIQEFLDEPWEDIPQSLQNALPEVWNVCTAIQDERDGPPPEPAEGELPVDPCQARFDLDGEREDAVESLRRHPLFFELGDPLFGENEQSETRFEVLVYPLPETEEDSPDEYAPPESTAVRVGSVTVSSDDLTLTALNPVELELLKALVLQLVAFSG